jgi:arylsulfatase
MIENIDRWLGVYIETLSRRGELDNTIIVYSSDHGEMLGDHGRWGKSIPYQSSIGVPLIVAGPGLQQGIVDRGPATTLDLTATYLDYAGIRTPASMESRSLRLLLEGQTNTHRDHVTSGLMGWRTVLDGRYKLVKGYDPSWNRKKQPSDAMLLFDCVDDPQENRDIADKAPGEVKRLMKLLPNTAKQHA